MTFQVGVVVQFPATHHLVGEFGPAREVHGHLYRVEAIVSGDTLRPDGTLFDITVLQDALRAATADLAGSDLNAVSALAEPNPTAEVLARYLFERVAPRLAGASLRQLTLRVWESAEAFASYCGEIT
jgi:6-pyruvoyltetrahydropterin/6-carboxytetrahydropterin synthase